jgi:hypothetical protein
MEANRNKQLPIYPIYLIGQSLQQDQRCAEIAGSCEAKERDDAA